MEQIELAGMIFTLILVMMVGGFVLAFPITRRLGALLEQRLQTRPPEERRMADLQRLEATVRELQQEIEQLSERQQFTESLLSDREPLLLRDDTPRR